MDIAERRHIQGPDRRRFPRGGRRPGDQPGRHPRVIVADSYEGARESCMRYLDHFNFDVVAATDGDALLAEITARPPAMILLDSHLKNPPSAEMLDNVAPLGIPIVMLANTDRRVDKNVLRAAAVLEKPFLLSSMLDTMRDILHSPAPVPTAS